MEHFTDAVAMVTGGASGIGRAVCEELAQRGARVEVADCDRAGAEAVAAGIAAAGGRARAVELDVTQADAVQARVDEAVNRYGRLDLMFNNAGIAIGGETQDMTLDHWRRIVEVNLMGVVHGVAAAYPVMLRQGRGHIVNTASVAGIMPVPMEAAYAATKFGIVGLSTSLRTEAAALGVNVSVVCPGFVRTPIFSAATVLKVDREAALAKMPPGVISAERAARIIADGVARNRAYIVFPVPYRILWWFYRLHPALLWPLWAHLARQFRSLPKASEVPAR